MATNWRTAGEDNRKVNSKGGDRVKGSLRDSVVQGAGQSRTWSSPLGLGGKGREGVAAEHGAEAITGKKFSSIFVKQT